ncbi:MAG: hypothetical protein CM1200mP14_03870 [Gammaproteobacteria bacterium]|nr:MAG: hypothetical protein CM1200mP14_03870 [Gammaproteobacteria bacterium]
MSSELLGLVIVVGITFLSSVIYVVSGAYRREDQNEIGDRGDFLLGSFVRSWLYWFLGPVERLAVGLKIAPLAFNLTGVGSRSRCWFLFRKWQSQPWWMAPTPQWST